MRFFNSTLRLVLVFFGVVSGLFLTTILNLLLIFSTSPLTSGINFQIFVFAFTLLYFLFMISFSAVLLKNYIKNRDFTNRLQNFEYIETLESQGIGVIFFTAKNKILRISPLVEKIFDDEVILGKSISLLLPKKFVKNVVDRVSIIEAIEELSKLQNEKFLGSLSQTGINKTSYFEGILNSFDSFVLEKKGFYYEAKIFWNKCLILLKDITAYRSILERYRSERNVIGEAHVDNIQHYEDYYSEEDFFQIQVTLANIFEKLAEEYNFIYKNYSHGRFWMLLDEETLDLWKQKRFSFFQEIFVEKLAIKLTLSVGFGTGKQELFELSDNSRRGLEESQLRGGNQVCIFSSENDKAQRYGSEFEIEAVTSRVKINDFANKLFEKLNDERITNVIIYGHKDSDLDALGATFALFLLVNNVFGKKAYIQNQTFDATAQDFIDQHPKELKRKKIFIKPKRAQELTSSNSLIIICDINDASRLENPKALENALAENVFIIDHHRIPDIKRLKNFKNAYVESNVSSTSELIVEILAAKNVKNIPTFAFQMLLNGIYVDTNRFQNASGFRTFTAVAFLRKKGALLEKTIESLKHSEHTEQTIVKLLENLIEIKPGFLLSYSDTEATTDTISMAADRVLEIKGRQASFVIGRLPKSDVFKLSARGINVNVQIICEAVGGGGHFGKAAAVVSKKDLKDFIENLKHAIVTTKIK